MFSALYVASAYFRDSLNSPGSLWNGIGFLLWLATVGISFVLALVDDLYQGSDRNYYFGIGGLSILTMVFVLIDYTLNQKNFVTVFTIATGSAATLFSIGLWAIDSKKILSTVLVGCQSFANAIQLAAIFNQNRKTYEIKKKETVKAKTFIFK